MTSLQGSLPESASGLWRVDREYGVPSMRVKHVVIHEAHVRDTPSRHVVYRVDVFTQERNWCVYRRYSEFLQLHEKISEMFKMFKGSFPPKQLAGNLSPAVIELRRSALEHYLLKIINSHNQDVSSCSSVLRFLDMHKNDVYHVTSALCRYVRKFGEAILQEKHFFVLSPTQLYCLHKRLRIPNSDADYKADAVFCDLGSLYDFVGRVEKICVKPCSLQDHGVRSEVTLLRNVKELHVQTVSVSLIKGLASLQLQIQRLKASQAVTAMKDLLIDCVIERKTQPKQPRSAVSSAGSSAGSAETVNQWRAAYNSKMIFNSYTIHPWISLLYLDLSHNNIRQLDDSFSLLPNLQELDLSYNQIDTLDLNYVNPALTKLTCSHSHVISVITKLHENLADLTLSYNRITDLAGFNKIVMLKKLNLYSNLIPSVDNIACLTELPRLHDISLAENPVARIRSYRNHILCMFTQACRRADIIVDGKTFSEKEKRRAKNTRVKGSTPTAPSGLPFFGNTSDQVPTAFTQQETKEDGWNSILHDLSASSSSSSCPEEDVTGQEALSLSTSDIRSTPSQVRTYDWDPAQAFASSAHSTPPPMGVPVALSGWDKTSSCDEGELGEVVGSSVSSSDVIMSPFNTSPSVKPFNSAFYQLSGPSDLLGSCSPPGGNTCKPHPGQISKDICKDITEDIIDSEIDCRQPVCNIADNPVNDCIVLKESLKEDDSSSDKEDSVSRDRQQDSSCPTSVKVVPPSGAKCHIVENTGSLKGENSGLLAGHLMSDKALSDSGIINDKIAASDRQLDSGQLSGGKIITSFETLDYLNVSDKSTKMKSTIAWPDTPSLSLKEDGLKCCEETFVIDRPDYDDIIFSGGRQTGDTRVDNSFTQENKEAMFVNVISSVAPVVSDLSSEVPLSDPVVLSAADHVTVSDHVSSQTLNSKATSEERPSVDWHGDDLEPRISNDQNERHTDSSEEETTDIDIPNEYRQQANSPDVDRQQTESPGLVTQQTARQQTESPGLVTQQTDRQQTDIPDVDRQQTDSPDVDRQQTDSPDVYRQQTESPGLVTQQTARQQTDSPDVYRQQTESPGVVTQQTARQQTESPDVYRQQTESPDMAGEDSPMIKIIESVSVSFESPPGASPGLNENTSSSDEVTRINKIESLSLGRHTADIDDLYDSEDSEDNSVELSFSNTKLTF